MLEKHAYYSRGSPRNSKPGRAASIEILQSFTSSQKVDSNHKHMQSLSYNVPRVTKPVRAVALEIKYNQTQNE